MHVFSQRVVSQMVAAFGAVLVLFFYTLTPLIVEAQAGGLVSQFINCNGIDCSACNLVHMANQIITWLIGVLFVVFGIMMVIAGTKLVTSQGNSAALTYAKDRFMYTVIGLLIILSAWLVVDTIMRGLDVQNMQRTGPLPWNQVECQVQTMPFAPDPIAHPQQLPSNANAPARQVPGDRISANEVRSILSGAGVSVQNGVESIDGLSRERVEHIARLAQQCAQAIGRSCEVQVSSGVRTAGNPSGVGSHGTGNAIDISARSALFNDWMLRQSGFPQEPSFGGYTGVRIPGTNTLCTWETRGDMHSPGAHWHCDPR